MKSKKLAVLIPDGEWDKITNQVNNCFSENDGICLYVMSNRKYIASRYSRFVKGYSYYPKTDDPVVWINSINKEVKKHKIDLILPVFEEGIEILIRFKELIYDSDKLVILPSFYFFDTARNKLKLAAHLAKHDIPGPKVFNLKSDNIIGDSIWIFPILAKPLEGSSGGKGILKFNDEETFLTFLKNKNSLNSKFVFQEYINGFDIDCSVLCRKGTIKAFTMQKGILYDSNDFSPPIGIQFLYEHRLYEVVVKLMQTLNWSGVAHIDLRYDTKNDEFKVIEVNCRFWTSLEASLKAGVNFPFLYCLLCQETDFDPPDFKHIMFLNKKALVDKIRSNVFFLGKVNFIWNYTPVKYMLRDPLPVLIRSLKRINYFLFK